MRGDWRYTNKRLHRLCIMAVMISAILFAFAGCAEYEYTYERTNLVRITVASSPAYEASWESISVERGTDVELTLTFGERGIVFDSCDYSDYTAENGSAGVTVLTLKNVRFPTFLNIRTRLAEGGIYYDANGGRTIAGGEGFIEWLKPSTHLRVNTSSGVDSIEREGYTQIGWNTAVDGTGDSVCLGGRVTPPDGEALTTLYAEWAKWLDGDDFGYKEIDGGITLTSYNGDKSADPFVIPGEIDGKSVIGIDADFAAGLTAKTLILPSTMQYVADKAFLLCRFDTLYMFDNIIRIDDKCFAGTHFKTLRINAVLKPRYLSTSEPAEFSDKMDRLMLHADEKKMVFFAGCSMSYGLDSAYMQETFPDYTVIDMGTMGGTNADMQLDCITPFLGEGDIFVHAPEQASRFQLFDDMNCDSNFFILCEGNPDLVSYVDLSKVFGVLGAFNKYNADRLLAAGGEWTDDNDYHNEYGDVVIPRGVISEDVKHGEGDYTYMSDYVTEGSFSRMCDYYDAISARGAEVLFSYAPVNYNGLPDEAVAGREWLTFAEKTESRLAGRGYPVISDIGDYLMNGRYFYDTDYHLNETGRDIRTRNLADDIKEYLENK